jgi:hypothetical protein
MFMSSIISALQIIFLLGLVLAVVGQIGRRVFASNSCWRCRFDLSGHPGVPDGPFPVICPECGESIPEPEMLRVDKQVPRSGLRRIGLVLMLAIVPVTFVFVRAGYSLDPYRVATNRAIIRVAELGDFRGLEEFQRRMDGDIFRQADLQEIGCKAAEIIRAMPQDRIEPGTPQSIVRGSAHWGNVYLELLRKNVVTEEDAKRLVRDIVRVELRFPPHNRVGDPFFYHIDFYGHAVSLEDLIPAGLEVHPVSVILNGEDLSALPISRSDAHLAPDFRTVNRSTTLASSWTFSIASLQVALTDSHEGVAAVEAKIVLRPDHSAELGFIAAMIEAVHGGELEFTLAGNLIVQPAGDAESARSIPKLADIIAQHGIFSLDYPPMLGKLALILAIDDRFNLPPDSVVRIRTVVLDQAGTRVLADDDFVISPDYRRAELILWDHTPQAVQDGGVWVELHPVKPYARNRAWRPLVITGHLSRVWVPLDEPNP